MTRQALLALSLSLLSTLAAATDTVLSQSQSDTPMAGVSVSCNDPRSFVTRANSYWRAFDLGPLNLGAPLVVHTVQFGVEVADANGVGTTQPVTVRVHTSAGGFPGGALTLQATQTINLPDQALTLVTVPLTTPTPALPANSIVVVEVAVPDGLPVSNLFFIGANRTGQTGPSFLQAPDCVINTPTNIASIGFPNVHWVLKAIGTVRRSLEQNLAVASAAVTAMTPPTVMGTAQQAMLLNLIKAATSYKDTAYRSLAVTAIDAALVRVDGCALRTTPDLLATQGAAGLDFVTTCPAQATVYGPLKAARDQLTAP